MEESMRRICFCRYGYANVPGKTDEIALEAAKSLSEHDIEWEPVNEEFLEGGSVVEVFEGEEENS